MNEREAYIALNMMQNVGPVRVRNLIESLGSVQEVFSVDRAVLCQVPKIGPSVADKILAQRDQLDFAGEERKAEKLGARIVTQTDDDYPAVLRTIHDPPLALYVKGTLVEEDKQSLCVIGSRRASHYGIQTSDRLSFQLAKCGFTIISGLARGIDGAAHEGALKAGGRTIAVLGSALDCLYPAEHEELAEKIAKSGAVISEFPLGTAPGRTTFPMRNRIVSGMTMGSVVVEAARGSGAMITVEEAISQGRLIFAVPGRIDSPGSSGCHKLIKDGAKLVETAEDIIEEFEYISQQNDSEVVEQTLFPLISLSDAEQAVVDALQGAGMSIDELCREIAQGPAQVNGMLIGLEMKKVIRMLPGRQIELIRPR